MIWRGIFQQFTLRRDNRELFVEHVRYPMNMFLFTIYVLYGLCGAGCSSDVCIAPMNPVCHKIFFAPPP